MTKATRERLEGMTVPDLNDLAERLKVDVPSKARKAELVKAIGAGWTWTTKGGNERWSRKGVAKKGKGKAAGKAQQDGPKTPTQQDLIREGLLAGLSNEEIAEKVREVYPGSAIKPTHVSWTIGNERRKGTDWWAQHGPKVAKDRGVALEPERAAASSEPKGKRKKGKAKKA